MSIEEINFETAKLVKEKGLRGYTGNVGLTNEIKYYSNLGIEKIAKNWNEIPDNAFIKFPQTIVQKWLRDVFEIHLCIDFKNKNEWYCDIFYLSGGMIKAENLFPTYESALENGIQIALKKII